jgi:NADPH2:quinone reductase
MPAIPSTMTHVALTGHGAPEVMQLAAGPCPQPAADEVLIRVLAAGVNRPDVAQRTGRYPPPPGASPILGLEVAGEVVARGPDVRALGVGDASGLANGGGYAGITCRKPVPAVCAATRRGACGSAADLFHGLGNLFQRRGLSAGERAGARRHERHRRHGDPAGEAFARPCYATAGSAEKCAACLRLGADAAFNHRTQDFAAEMRRLTDGRGVDVILDMVGAGYFNRNLASLARDGRLVIIAFLLGAKVDECDLTPIMLKRLVITGSTLRPRTTAEKAAIAAELRERVWPLLNAGRCAPVIHSVFPLADVVGAHRLIESGTHIGKIVLEVAAPARVF